MDVFRKMPKDLTEATFCGAVVSMLCTGFLAVLCATEFQKYMAVDTRSNMLVDGSHHDDRLTINVDIVFPKMPCEVLSLDIMDVMGTHIQDIAGSLFKRRISESGEFISETSMLDYVQNRADLLKKVKEEMDQKQGCQLKGFFSINRVPGNFHVSSHAHNDMIVNLEMQGYSFDFTHKINHVSFGLQQDYEKIKNKFENGQEGVLNPIDGLQFSARNDTNNKPMQLTTNFYLIAVSSHYEDTDANTYNMYQLTSTHKSQSNTQVNNMLMFSYELSPIKVMFTQEKENIIDFMTYICALVGGIFTIAGVVDALIHRSMSLLFKQRIGKLS